MTDVIYENLRRWIGMSSQPVEGIKRISIDHPILEDVASAADEINSLRAENERLREGIQRRIDRYQRQLNRYRQMMGRVTEQYEIVDEISHLEKLLNNGNDDGIEWHNEAYANAAQEMFREVSNAIREYPDSTVARSPLIQRLLEELGEQEPDRDIIAPDLDYVREIYDPPSERKDDDSGDDKK